MSESNDPWDSIKPSQPRPAPNPYASPTPTPQKPRWPGPAPLHGPSGWRGDTIRQYAVWGLVISIVTTVIGLLCCAFLPAAGFAMSVPAFLMARHDLAFFAHDTHPDFLDELTTSRNLALAAVIVSSVGTLLGLVCMGLNIGFFALQMAIDQQR